jgi:hypothetical protein
MADMIRFAIEPLIPQFLEELSQAFNAQGQTAGMPTPDEGPLGALPAQPLGGAPAGGDNIA